MRACVHACTYVCVFDYASMCSCCVVIHARSVVRAPCCPLRAVPQGRTMGRDIVKLQREPLDPRGDYLVDFGRQTGVQTTTTTTTSAAAAAGGAGSPSAGLGGIFGGGGADPFSGAFSMDGASSSSTALASTTTAVGTPVLDEEVAFAFYFLARQHVLLDERGRVPYVAWEVAAGHVLAEVVG